MNDVPARDIVRPGSTLTAVSRFTLLGRDRQLQCHDSLPGRSSILAVGLQATPDTLKIRPKPIRTWAVAQKQSVISKAGIRSRSDVSISLGNNADIRVAVNGA